MLESKRPTAARSLGARPSTGCLFSERRSQRTAGDTESLSVQLAPLMDRRLAAAIGTHMADVEIELNGHLTYDRAVPKMDEQRIARAHRALCRALH